MKINVDICIVGAGSGGVAAAYSAAKHAPHKKVLIVESQSVIGGTSTIGGVNAWEPGCVGYGKLHYKLFDELSKNNNAVIAKYDKILPKPRLCAYVSQDENASYDDTLRRKYPYRIIYDPKAMVSAMYNRLMAFDNLTVLCNCALIDALAVSGRIECIKVYDSSCNEFFEIYANQFIDSTAEIVLARMAGCATELSKTLNGISQMFIAEEKGYRQVDALPKWVENSDAPEWINKNDPDVIFNRYPDGKLNANTLCTIDGDEYLSLGTDAKKTAVARTYAFWNALQKERGLDNYRLSYIFPMLGVREGYRLRGKYILTENDIMLGHKKQNLKNSFIAFSDHAVDVHKCDNNKLIELDDFYGVPYECTLPNETENLAIACRGISLSSVAASSCRLQRTIMQIGEAVGIAATISKNNSFHDVDCDMLFNILKK